MSTTTPRYIVAEDYGGGLQFQTGSSVSAMLNDNSDTTYIQGATSGSAWAIVQLDPMVFPDGAQIRSHTLKVRLGGAGGLFRAELQSTDGYQWFTSGVKPPAGVTGYQWTKSAWTPAKTVYTWAPISTNKSIGQGWTQRTAWTIAGGRMTPAGSSPLALLLQLDPGVKCYRLELDTVYNEQSVVTIASIDGSISAPSFATTRQRPKVWWVWSDPDGDRQERFHVVIHTDEKVNAPKFTIEHSPCMWNSGFVVSAANSYVIPKSLQAGTYWAFVRACDVGSHTRWSNWDKVQFTVAGSPPNVPTLVSAVPDAANGRNVITVQESDNLLAYQQAGYEVSTDGFAWYKDTNVTTLAPAVSAATNIEGTKALAMTCTAASRAEIRSGGPWTSLGVAGVANISRVGPFDAGGNLVWVNEPCPVDDIAPSGGHLRTASFNTTSGNVLVALIAFKAAPGADPSNGATVTSTPTLTWTKHEESKRSQDGRNNYTAIFTATATGAATIVDIIGGTAGYGRYLKVLQYAGVNTSSPVGAKGHFGSYKVFSQNYTSTSAGSLGLCQTIDDKAGPLANYSGSGMSAISIMQRSTYSVSTMSRSSNTSNSGQTVTLSDHGNLGDVSYTWIELMPSATPPAGVPSTFLSAIPVTASTAYTLMGGAWVATTANTIRNYRFDVEWYYSTGTIISTTPGTSTATTAGNLLSFVTSNITSPAGATSAVIVAVAISPAAGEVYHFDQVGLACGSDQNWSRGGMQCLNLLNVNDGTQEGHNIGSWVKTPGPGYATTTFGVLTESGVLSGQCLTTYGSNSAWKPKAQTGTQLGANPGVTYTFSTMAITVAGVTNGYVGIQFLDALGMVVASATSDAFSLSSTSWSTLAVTADCPPGATGVKGLISSDYVTSGNAVKWTRHAVSPGAVTPTAWQPGPMPDAYPLVEGSDDGGDTWTAVRGTELANYDSANSWQATVYDYEAPSNAVRTYRAKTAGIDYGIDTAGFYVSSSASATADVTLPVTDFYLVDAYTPTRFLMEQEGEIDITSAEPQTVYAPLGRSTEVVTYDTPKSKHFKFILGMLNGTELTNFEALRSAGNILFLQTPYALSWYVKIGSTQETKWLISPDVTGRFTVTVELIEVDRPD